MRRSKILGGTVTSVLAAVLVACSSKTAPTQVEIRRAELAPAAGLTPAVSRSGNTVYVNDLVEFTDRDFADAEIAADNLGRPAVLLTLTDEAAPAFGAMTGEHIGRPLAVMVHGELVAAPILQSRLSNVMMITGLSAEEAQGIVDDLGSGS